MEPDIGSKTGAAFGRLTAVFGPENTRKNVRKTYANGMQSVWHLYGTFGVNQKKLINGCCVGAYPQMRLLFSSDFCTHGGAFSIG